MSLHFLPRRFSLRTLLVLLTLVCGITAWLAAQFRWIHDRHEAISSETFWEEDIERIAPSGHPAPWSLRVFREKGIDCLVIVDRGDIDLAKETHRASRLFPESTIKVYDRREPRPNVTYID